jgi:hypothetical protein
MGASPPAILTAVFSDSPWPLHTTVGAVSQIWQRSLSSASFPFHCSLIILSFAAMQSLLLKVSSHIPWIDVEINKCISKLYNTNPCLLISYAGHQIHNFFLWWITPSCLPTFHNQCENYEEITNCWTPWKGDQPIARPLPTTYIPVPINTILLRVKSRGPLACSDI